MCVAEHAWVYLNAIIDPLIREIVGWELSVRWRATEAIAVIPNSGPGSGHRPGITHARHGHRIGAHCAATRLALPGLGLRSPGSASLTVAATTATGRQALSSYGSAI